MAQRQHNKRRREQEQSSNLDLAPFMNMVVILIPMLLLSVIFVSAGVINVSTDLATGTHSAPNDGEEALELTVALSNAGFEVMAAKERLPAVDGCPAEGPTICLADTSVDVAGKFDEAKRLYDAGKPDAAKSVLDGAMQAYDFRGLYNQLAQLKKAHPEETRVVFTGEPDMPYAMLIRAMDVARFKLEKDNYRESTQFWAANERVQTGKTRALFSDPVLAIAQ
ncbi:hypothetical protein FIV42_06265 [Persicimonas caeni]|uniref:Biopolymer transporter ExbD n=1 Tax=Persicimonas caeni TaxID=2292766 RepID=A0A4Y6PQG6_PERCE|nr:biopolymer transporter ExbD [Persicimonas caeni]QDG50349.1 hypothetical protein FIV42_06265 [Persicimonas caeni]QED31570.1 hypothetical protein FRD00_06260 [Persicimonas caeni]